MPRKRYKYNILFFLRYNSDKASSRIRGFYLCNELKKNLSVNCSIIHGSKIGKYFKLILEMFSHKVIYFQKQYSVIDIRTNRLARSLGRITLFDLDDAPFGLYRNQRACDRAIVMMKNVSAVIVGSEKLKEFALPFNDRTYLLPSSINLEYYRARRRPTLNGVVTLGWIGDGVGYKYDLMMLIEPINKIAKKCSVKLIIVGALGQKEIYDAFSSLKGVEVSIIDTLEWEKPHAVPLKVQDFDIGLYPLLDNDYNRYKCGFKALEYMAMGFPVVASPVGEINNIIEHGQEGFLASNEDEWYDCLLKLASDSELRWKMGRAGRKKVESYYSIAKTAKRLQNIIEEIV